MRTSFVSSCLAIAALGACSSSSSTGPRTGGLRLTADQAQSIVLGVGRIVASHPEVAWLADSISVVVQAGAEVDSVAMTTDLASGPFYAVALQRAFDGNGQSTFDIIAFNDPSAPTSFIIIDAYQNAGGAAAPDSASGAFESTTGINGHLFQVTGDTVLAWRAAAGDVSFAAAAGGGACLDFQGPPGVTCAQQALNTAFTITATTPEDGTQTGAHSASLPATTVAGARLDFTP